MLQFNPKFTHIFLDTNIDLMFQDDFVVPKFDFFSCNFLETSWFPTIGTTSWGTPSPNRRKFTSLVISTETRPTSTSWSTTSSPTPSTSSQSKSSEAEDKVPGAWSSSTRLGNRLRRVLREIWRFIRRLLRRWTNIRPRFLWTGGLRKHLTEKSTDMSFRYL